MVFSKAEKLSSKIRAFELIGRTNEGIIIMKWGESLQQIECLNPETMTVLWRKEIVLEGKNLDVVQTINLGNEVVLFYSSRQNGIAFLYGQRYTSKMEKIDGLVLLDQEKKKLGSRNFEFEVVTNTDKTKFALVKKFFNSFNYDKVEVQALSQTLKPVFKKEVVFVDQEWYKETAVSLSGEIFVLTGKMKRSLFSSETQYESVVIKKVTSAEKNPPAILIGDDNYWINDFKTAFDHVNNQMIIGGFCSNQNQRYTSGHFFCALDLATKEVKAVKYKSFSEEMLKTKSASSTWNTGSRIEYIKVNELIVRSDGGLMIVGENSFTTEARRNLRPTNSTFVGRASDQMVISHYYNDIFVLSVKSDGDLDWGKVLMKNQYSEEDQGYFSSFAVFNGSNNLRFIFNEEIKYNTNVTSFTLQTDGDADVRGLFNASSFQVKLSPRHFQQISKREILIPGYNQRMEFLLAKIAYPKL